MNHLLLRRLPPRQFKNPLPLVVQEALKQAASTDPLVPLGMSKARTKAIDEAIREIKKRFPQYFKE